MFNFLKKASLGLLLLGATAAQGQKTPVGYVISESGCASGGNDYYFFDKGQLIMVCEGCEQSPLVWVGTWSQSGDKITMKFSKEYAGIGEGAHHVPVGSVRTYDVYKATSRAINETETATWGANPLETDDCTERKKHSSDFADLHDRWLMGSFRGKYTQTSKKLLTAAELKKYSKAELKIMRNEIFARYGYIFKTEDMRAYFEKQGHYGFRSDVTAFLSEIETKNIEVIKKAETTAK